jgi:hypothetical protein
MGQWDSVSEQVLQSLALPQFAPLYLWKAGPHTAEVQLLTIATTPLTK